ncbi:MAG: FumA C-terminus/TtdB family hydratase beta subunit [Candidatus Izemoplasmatales bacterium]
MIRLTTPIHENDLLSLKVGDEVLISGKIYTARDAAHKRLLESYEQTGKLPISLEGEILYYVGPTPEQGNLAIGSAGPTSSYRMDPYSIKLMPLGAKIMIGKGDRSDLFVSELKKNRAVYFIAVGGIGALLSKTIQSSKVIMYEDLQSEAIRELQVENFPVIVAYDSNGLNIFK